MSALPTFNFRARTLSPRLSNAISNSRVFFDCSSVTISASSCAAAAARIAAKIEAIEGKAVQCGTLDITLHRDDLRMRPPRALMPTTIPPLGVENRSVILVDDVLFSGRTIRAALDAVGEIGRPAAVQLAVLIDRGHRQLPIRADYVGKNLPTSLSQIIKVQFTELDGVDEVTLEEGNA
jgi:pyrimidine operon attenuation protein/uracil phosphoribosyltransferase